MDFLWIYFRDSQCSNDSFRIFARVLFRFPCIISFSDSFLWKSSFDFFGDKSANSVRNSFRNSFIKSSIDFFRNKPKVPFGNTFKDSLRKSYKGSWRNSSNVHFRKFAMDIINSSRFIFRNSSRYSFRKFSNAWWKLWKLSMDCFLKWLIDSFSSKNLSINGPWNHKLLLRISF